MEQSVPERRHINFRRRGITQKKAYNKFFVYLSVKMIESEYSVSFCFKTQRTANVGFALNTVVCLNWSSFVRSEINSKYLTSNITPVRSQWPRGLRRRSAAARLLRLWVRIPSKKWMFVCCECCVWSGRGLCDELITRPEESYRLWCVVV
jgi:hypothetical protein